MENKFEEYCVDKFDDFLSENDITATSKRKFKETKEIHGTVYKFSHIGVEIVKDQVTIFGKYKSKFFDAEAFNDTDQLLKEFLPKFKRFYENPVLTKHPMIRFFSRVKE